MLKVVLVKMLVQSNCEMAISVMEILEELLETERITKNILQQIL